MGRKPVYPTSSKVPVVIWLAIGLLILSMVEFVNVNSAWLKPFGRDLGRWVLAPQISGPLDIPHDWPVWAVMYAMASVPAWLIATAALSGTALKTDLVARAGTAIVLAFAFVGYAGMLLVILGRLDPVLLWAFLGGAAAVAIAVWFLSRQRHSSEKPTTQAPASARQAPEPEAGLIKWIGIALGTMVVMLSAIHSLMAPVTEIDATIYHAAAARLWFLTRPDPGLLFGPSIGIEISGNYPPLFPAIGLSAYLAIGRFDDFYLRLVPPVLAVALLAVTFAYARWHAGSRVAWWVVVLMLGSPLLVMYMAWTTNYLLLATLSVLVLMYCELAATSGRSRSWAVAGLLAGLAVLTNFYGWVTFGFAFFAFLLWMRSWHGVRALALFSSVALLVAAPWLVRNWVELGDPIYPLADHIFRGAGLIQPFWGVTEGEIERSALSIYGVTKGFKLLTLESAVALESNYLIPAGLVMGLVVGIWRGWQRDRRALYLTGAVLLIVIEVLTPGWYWVRALLPLVPIGSILAGQAIDSAFKWIDRYGRVGTIQRVGASLWTSALIGVAVLSLVTSFSLSLAGPNQQTWTTDLPSSADFMASVRNLGGPEKQISTAFGPDYASWQWLNAHLGPNEHVATFEIRTYYFDDPQGVFYLDGLEAVPLLRLHTPDSIRRYLDEHKVRFVMIPGWSRSNPTAHALPLVGMLGTPGQFPLLETWGGTDLYAVNPDDPLVRSSVGG